MKITISGNVIEGTPEELAEYFAMTEDLAKVDTCEDACCEDATETIQADDIITFEGAEYRKVDRKAREGDVVIFREGIVEVAWITVDKPYVIIGIGNDSAFIADDDSHTAVYRNEERYNRTRETVDVYEPIAVDKPKATKSYEPKVGDIVVITGNGQVGPCNPHAFNVGDVEKVANVLSDRIRGTIGDNSSHVMTQFYRPATAEEIAQYEKAVADANKPKLKAGDFVVFSEVDWCYDDITIGTPYEIYFDGEDLAFKDDVGDERVGPLNDDDCEYEILTAEEAKWARLGRKVDEYKVGDIAEVIISPSAHAVGTLVKITRERTADSVYAKANGDTKAYGHKHIRLIAPVESVLTHN